METILKPFVSRFAQPVILSFCIAWIFWNWEIVVGLLWYDKNTLPLYGYKNYKDLIHQNAIWQRNYLYPLAISIAYPYIRYGLNYFNTILKTEERNQTLIAAGTGKMSTLKFLELRKSYEDKIAELSKYLEEQSDIQKRANKSDTELLKLKTEFSTVQENLRKCEETKIHHNETSHHFQMEIQSKDTDISNLNIKIKDYEEEISSYRDMNNYYESKINLYETKSNPENILGRYVITIEDLTSGLDNNTITLNATFEKRDRIIFAVNGTYVADLASYSYNILKNSFILMLSKDIKDVHPQINNILGVYIEFSIIDQFNYIGYVFLDEKKIRIEINKK